MIMPSIGAMVWECCRHCDHDRQPAPHTWPCAACQYLPNDRVKATQDRRRSNAAGPHGDRRTKRLRDRAAAKRQALKEQNDV